MGGILCVLAVVGLLIGALLGVFAGIGVYINKNRKR
jgi:hypothetical protein